MLSDDDLKMVEIKTMQQKNPWLSREDCERWVNDRWKERHPPKCCPCAGQGPGIVRHVVQVVYPNDPAYVLGPCKCDCHTLRPR